MLWENYFMRSWDTFLEIALCDRLERNYSCVYVLELRFSLFFLFFFGSTAIVDFVNCEQCIRALFTVPQITLFNNFFIKNGSHSNIYTFKNYFATVFSISVFSFSKNKLNPNTSFIYQFSKKLKPQNSLWLYLWEQTPSKVEAHECKLCLGMKDNSKSTLFTNKEALSNVTMNLMENSILDAHKS